MSGMQDRIIHAYDSVDMEIVWEVVISDIPRIKPKMQQVLRDYPG